MRIKKIENVVGLVGHVLKQSTKSDVNTYSANYLNDRIAKVSLVEPTTGEKVWIQKGKNLFDIRKITTSSSNGLTYTPNVNNNSLNVTGTPTGYSSCALMENFKPEHDFIISLNGNKNNTTNMQIEVTFYKNGSLVTIWYQKTPTCSLLLCFSP